MNPWSIAGVVLVAAALYYIHKAVESANQPAYLDMTSDRRRMLIAVARAQDAELGFL